ncbi:MAG: DUF11 domain-containing protein, partial [Chloroflexi bacterium]|nr:DUF11 domain-containing protein [Chloroflexota bacterium]
GDLDEGSVFNEACVDDGEGGAAEACDDVDTPGEDNPALAIDKVDETGGFDEVGDVIEYTIVATNVGNVTLHDVVVTDEQVSDLECTRSMPVDLAPGESITCTASHTVVEADFETLLVFNQACVDDGEGGADEVCDEVNTPGQELEEETDLPTLPPTTSLPGSSSAPSSDAWWLVIALGAFMAMLLAVTPRRERKRR